MYRSTKKVKLERFGIQLAIVAVAAVLGGVTGILLSRKTAANGAKAADPVLSQVNVPDSKPVQDSQVVQDSKPLQNSKPSQEGQIVQAVPQTKKERLQPLVVIDPGHGGLDEGCVGTKVQEKDINLSIALCLENILTENGYRVVMTRRGDISISPKDRVLLANSENADAFISIHQNASEASQGTGIETWCQQGSSDDSKRLARLVHKYTVEKTGARDRGLQEEGDLYVIRETSMASCLIETGFLCDEKEEQLLMDPQYQEKLACGIAAGVDLYFYPKTMYLTFDDGPSAENTSAVLDILAEKNVKATFFVVGENVRKNPEVARRIVEEGHTIGIHCNRHEYDVIYESADSYLEDFEAAWQAVYEVTGVEAKLFRFPGGSINSYNREVCEEIIQEMTDRGYIYFDWNASLEDAVRKADPGQLIANAKKTALGRKKVVMLAHDIVYGTTLCLGEMIDQFTEYRMEPLSEDVTPIQF